MTTATQALRALDDLTLSLDELPTDAVEQRAINERIECVHAALAAAAALQQDIESIEAYGRAHPVLGPSVFFLDNKWRGHITEEFGSMCDGESYAEVHSKLAAWCKKDLAK